MHIPTAAPAAPCLVIAMQFVKLGFLLQLNGEKSLDEKKIWKETRTEINESW